MSLLLRKYGLKQYIPQLKPSPMVSIIVAVACFMPALLLGIYLVLESRSRNADPTGCRKIGLRIQSHLADEQDKRYLRVRKQDGEAQWKVKSLWTYPVKSCRGVELNKGRVLGTGMEYDRQFSFAQLSGKCPAGLDTSQAEEDTHKWKFVSQRQIPAMATIKTELWVPEASFSAKSRNHPNVQSGGILVIKYPNLEGKGMLWGGMLGVLTLFGGRLESTIHIPFNPSLEQIKAKGYRTVEMEIWKDKPKSLLIASTETNHAWMQGLRSYLGITNHLALFRVSKDDTRREVYRCAPRFEQIGYQPTVGFQDAYPLHILNLASIHDVGSKLEKSAPPLSALNFRPNIVIIGGDAYTEDSWKRIKIGKYEYYVSCRTVRCLLPNVNPKTGERHKSEPNKTLKSFRCIDPGDPKNACLGMQMVPAVEESTIKVGDAIKILETGQHVYIKQ